MTLIFRLIIRRDIWISHSKVFSSSHKSFAQKPVLTIVLDPETI